MGTVIEGLNIILAVCFIEGYMGDAAIDQRPAEVETPVLGNAQQAAKEDADDAAMRDHRHTVQPTLNDLTHGSAGAFENIGSTFPERIGNVLFVEREGFNEIWISLFDIAPVPFTAALTHIYLHQTRVARYWHIQMLVYLLRGLNGPEHITVKDSLDAVILQPSACEICLLEPFFGEAELRVIPCVVGFLPVADEIDIHIPTLHQICLFYHHSNPYERGRSPEHVAIGLLAAAKGPIIGQIRLKMKQIKYTMKLSRQGEKSMSEQIDKIELVRRILAEEDPIAEDEDIVELLLKKTISKNVDHVHKEKLSFGGKAADAMVKAVGSWGFVISFLVLIVVWMGINIYLLSRPYDPYPFILLNLVLSCVAAIQAPIIMMSQNRQEEKDRIRAQNDYRVNLKAEIMVEDLHHKLDTLIENQKMIMHRMALLEEKEDKEAKVKGKQ